MPHIPRHTPLLAPADPLAAPNAGAPPLTIPDDFLGDARFLAPRRALRTDGPDGSFVLRSPEALQPFERCVGEWLERWARETPQSPAFAEPAPGAAGPH